MNIKVTSFIWVMLCIALSACNNEAEPDNTEEAQLNDIGYPAIEAVTEKLAQDPENPELYAARAELYYENEGYDEAIHDMQRALTYDSLNIHYLHFLADVYLDYYQSQQALQTMERAAELYPQRIPTLLKLSEFQFILKQYSNSMKTIDRILQIDPQNEEAFFMFGMNFKESGDTARAINSFQQAVELEPELIDAWINLGQLHAALGHPIAIQYFDSAIEIAPQNPVVLHAKAEYLSDQNQLPEAIELYRRINRIDRQYEEAYYNAGLLFMELDSLERAYEHFDLAIKVDPVHVRAYFYRGLAAEWRGQTEKARQDYQQALRLAPEYEDPKRRLDQLEEESDAPLQ